MHAFADQFWQFCEDMSDLNLTIPLSNTYMLSNTYVQSQSGRGTPCKGRARSKGDDICVCTSMQQLIQNMRHNKGDDKSSIFIQHAPVYA
jgi:hypothetical protein